MIKIIDVGQLQMPTDPREHETTVYLCDANARKINQLFLEYYGLEPNDRYMGSFPYPDRETGQCKVLWHLSMQSIHMRDAIVDCLRATISKAGLLDIVVTKENGDPEERWPANMGIVAMGPSVTNALSGEQKIQEALDLLEVELLC